MPTTARSRFLVWAAALCVAAVVVALAADSPAPRTVATDTASASAVSGGALAVTGHGFGHGRGMSQYGARGAALSGLSTGQILDFYYPGTAPSVLPRQNVRVLVSGDEGVDVLVLPSHNLSVVDVASGARELLPPGPTQWRILALPTGRLQVQANINGAWTGFAVGGQSTLAGPVHFTGTDFVRLVLPGSIVRGYRAEIIAYATGASQLQTVNMVSFEDYLRGVVPVESPSSWPAAALEAQAIAARSYSEYKRARAAAGNYDICDTTACQVYRGARTYNAAGVLTGSVETASTDAAVAATALHVRSYAGAVILAEFSSSNGGHTAAGSAPYFVSKPDPYEAAGGNPNATWTVSIPAAMIQAAFPAVGTLTGATVTTRAAGGDWGGRAGTVVLHGIDGAGRATSVQTTGDRIRSVGGLKSSYFAFTGPPLGDPRGSVDEIGPDRGYTGQVTVRGWTLDDDAPTTPTQVHIYLDGKPVTSIQADQPRADVANAYPNAGSAHGYSTTITVPAGPHTVCVFAINLGPGTNKLLECRAITVLEASPVGAVDLLGPETTSGAVTVKGWAFDPSAPTQSLTTHVYVDGKGVGSYVAADARADVAAAYPGVGEAHGFRIPLTLAAGNHSVCVFAINVGAGTNTLLQCKVLNVLPPDPIGVVDAVALVSNDGQITVRGWAFDPDEPTRPLDIHVYVDGRGSAHTSNVARADVARLYPGVGGTQGFAVSMKLAPGSHEVCAFAINVAAGSNLLLHCSVVSVMDRAIVGTVDAVAPAVSSDGQITVRGWAFDPDVPTQPLDIHVYIDGRGYARTSDVARADVARIYPGAGGTQGFRLPFTLAAGSHDVCVFAIGAAGGANLLLHCSVVSVVDRVPVGTVDAVTSSVPSDGQLTVRGWAFDPDAPTQPLDIHVYIDGRGYARTSDVARADLARIYPGVGGTQGFNLPFTVAAGSREVCVFAIGAKGGANVLLHCSTVTVK